MTTAVFIAKSNDEFNLYMGDFPPSTDEGGVQDYEGGVEDSQTAAQEIKIGSHTPSCNNVIITRKDWVDVLKDAVRTGDENISKYFDAFFDEMKKALASISLFNEGDNFYVFCHWGDGGDSGGVADMDNAFQDAFKVWRSSNAGFEHWKIYAISSMRNDIFDVKDISGGGRLGLKRLPASSDEVLKLAEDLKEASEKYQRRTYKCEAGDVVVTTNCRAGCFQMPLTFVPTSEAPTVGKLASVLAKTCQRIGYNVREMADFSSADRFYPFFVDFEYMDEDNERVRVMDNSGFSIPDEFVLRIVKHQDGKDDVTLTIELVKSLQKRLDVWTCDDRLKNGLTFADVKDWMGGAFRRFCMLDEDVHGTAGTIDVLELEKSPGEVWQANKSLLKARFNGRTPFKNLWRKVFDVEMKTLEDCLTTSTLSDKQCGELFKNKIVFCPMGTQVVFLSPFVKFTGLLIDDDAQNAKCEIEGTDVGQKTIGDIINFKSVVVSAKKSPSVVRQAIDEFKQIFIKHESYDFVLLDLRLADPVGMDPSGYHLIKYIKQFFPNLPIVIYSRYDDMGHMARAFQMGADWFIRKDEIRKLPRHLQSLFSKLNWREEWNAITNKLNLFKVDRFFVEGSNPIECAQFKSAFTVERMYLTYKVLEKLPGTEIVISPMRGGHSSSITFCARRGTTTTDGRYLQNPVIIKIDAAFNTISEYERYFRFIRPYIANESGRIESRALTLDRKNSVIVYTFAGRQNDGYELNSMCDMMRRDVKNRSTCCVKSYDKAFDIIFNEILPRIHAVRPNVEFGRNVTALFSDFPNRAFGEVRVDKELEKIDADNFLANWLCRMPLGRILKDVQHVTQEATPIRGYEFRQKGIVDDCGEIEALSFDEKCTVIMKGDCIDHIVRYRHHAYPGMTLWVRGADALPDVEIEEAIPAMVEMAMGKLHGDVNRKVGICRAANEFAEILKRLMKEPLSAGKPSDDFYKFIDTELKGENEEGNDSCWETAFSKINDKVKTAFNALPGLLEVARKLLKGCLSEKLMDCPAGIVHGDLNYTNIMLETKKPLSGESVFTNRKLDVKDVWLIDFARTRRDLIAHDFNVLFTSTLGLLFDLDVWRSEETIGHDIYYQSARKIWGERVKVEDTVSYSRFIETIFRTFIVKAVFDELDAVPDGMEHDERISLIFKILRRIRAAALKAGMSKEAYAFTTALSCMVAARVYIAHEQNAPAAAAMIATAFICFAQLKRMEAEVGK